MNAIRHPAPDVPPARMVHGVCSSERIVDSSPSRDGSKNNVLVAGGCDLITPIPLLYEHKDVIGEITYFSWIKKKRNCIVAAPFFTTRLDGERGSKLKRTG
jgi:hypothetical protein